MSLSLINGSDGTGEAVVATVSVARTAGSMSISVSGLAHWPASFVATSGKQLSGGVLSTPLVFSGHKSGTNTIVIDTIAPGYTDGGNQVSDIIVLKPSTMWADNIASTLAVSHTDTGALNTGVVGNAQLATGAVTPDKANNNYKFSVYRNAAWTCPMGLLIFDTKLFDSSTAYSTTTGKYTAPISGFYQLNVAIDSYVTAGIGYFATIVKNGTVNIAKSNGYIAQTANTSYNTVTASHLVQLTAGDTIQVNYIGKSGETGLTGLGSTYFSGFLVSAT